MYDEAHRRAADAAIDYVTEAMKKPGRPGPKGHCFCHVKVLHPVRHPFVKWCRENGIGHYTKKHGLILTNVGRYGGKDLMIEVGAAEAFCDVLREYEIETELQHPPL